MDDLNTPLAGPKAKRRPRLPVSLPQFLASLLGLFLIVFAVWTVTAEDPLGGEPVVTASLKQSGAANASNASAKKGSGALSHYDGPARAGGGPTVPLDGGKTITIIDGTNGKRQEVPILGAPEQQASTAGIDERLLEGKGERRIPKVVAGGLRSIEAYASPAVPARDAARGPRIAIVVGGLGVSASVTADALSRLPPAVTLAFVPYGTNLSDLAALARTHGHEVLLQAAMEPFDYPDNDPGPQTLLTTLSSEKNLERLHWQMSRFQGYVGVMNLMGARFTTTEKSLAPILDDIAKRGLLYFEDGSLTRSLASRLAATSNMPFTKADAVLDAVQTPAEIDRALARLEAAARQHGIAVGMATALPASIDRIVRWAKGVESRGITLVPVTVAALKPKSS